MQSARIFKQQITRDQADLKVVTQFVLFDSVVVSQFHHKVTILGPKSHHCLTPFPIVGSTASTQRVHFTPCKTNVPTTHPLQAALQPSSNSS